MANGKRLIDVDVAEKSIRTSASLLRANIGCGYDEGAADALSSVADMLKTMPTVDAVEVVHGYWHIDDCDSGEKGRLDEVAEIIADILIANGVTIPVRCKECKWAEYGKDYEPYCNHWKSGLYANIKDDDFCSYGERRTDDSRT